MTNRFPDKTALITGHASGIGAATAALLSSEGARIIGVDLWQGQDVADPALWQEVASDLADIDVAVINAGIATAAPLVDLDFADWRRTLSVNLDGAMLSVQAAMRAMIGHGRGGAIVVTASIAGLKAEAGTAAYAASKAGAIHLARVAAKEGAPHGIRVNAIAPGGVDTPIWDATDFFRPDGFRSGQPRRRDHGDGTDGHPAWPLGDRRGNRAPDCVSVVGRCRNDHRHRADRRRRL